MDGQERAPLRHGFQIFARPEQAAMRPFGSPLAGSQPATHRRFESMPETSFPRLAPGPESQEYWQPPPYLAPSLSYLSRPLLPSRTAPSSLSSAFDGLQSGSSTSSQPQQAPMPLLRAHTTGHDSAPQHVLRSPLAQPLHRPLRPVSVDLAPLTAQPMTYFNYETGATVLQLPEPPPPPPSVTVKDIPHHERFVKKVISDRPYKCDECPQSFHRGHDLKRHKKIHLPVKPYPCGWCEKGFARRDALKRHLLVSGCGVGMGQTEEDSGKGVSRAPALLARQLYTPLLWDASPTGLLSDAAASPSSPASFDESMSNTSPAGLSPGVEGYASPSIEGVHLPSPRQDTRPLPPTYVSMPPPLVFDARPESISPRIEALRLSLGAYSPRSPVFEAVAPLYMPVAKSSTPPAFVSHASFASFASDSSTPSSAEISDNKSPGFFGSVLVPTLDYLPSTEAEREDVMQ